MMLFLVSQLYICSYFTPINSATLFFLLLHSSFHYISHLRYWKRFNIDTPIRASFLLFFATGLNNENPHIQHDVPMNANFNSCLKSSCDSTFDTFTSVKLPKLIWTSAISQQSCPQSCHCYKYLVLPPFVCP